LEEQIMGDERRISPFEAIKHTTEDGGEYWSARELMVVLGYAKWQNFAVAITRAKEACQNSSIAVSDHFTETSKMVQLGSGATREVEDYNLSRYACYLIVQNGDPEKPVIAAGQTYFAIRTREAELTEEALA
jgi:DNA-damage-inducible protein D